MFGDVDLAFVAIKYFCLLLSLCIHEAAHAAMAHRCGDSSAAFMGRLSLNPLAHIDPIGTVVMPLLMMTTGIPYLIGWAKPVPVNPRNLRNMRRDQVLVALAGPGSNLLLAFVAATILRIGVMITGIPSLHELLDSTFFFVVFVLMMTNIGLMVFNLLPVPPLDGGWVLHYFLPPAGQRVVDQFGQYGILFVILVGSRLIQFPFEVIRNVAMWFIGF